MNIVELTKDNFEQEVMQSDVPVLVDFWAAWCGPCKMQGPVMDEIATAYDTIKVGKINVDEQQQLAMQYGVSSIPTLILFQNGSAEKRLVGLHSREQLEQALDLA